MGLQLDKTVYRVGGFRAQGGTIQLYLFGVAQKDNWRGETVQHQHFTGCASGFVLKEILWLGIPNLARKGRDLPISS